jgi:hypothetical protein
MKEHPVNRFSGAYSEVTNLGVVKNRVVCTRVCIFV